MTGWIVFGCILLVLIWIFTRPVKVTAVYDAHPELWVKILCFTLVKVPQDPEKQKKKAAKEARKAAKKAEKERREAAKHRSGANMRLLELAEERERAENAESGDDVGKAPDEKEHKAQNDTAEKKPEKQETPKKQKKKKAGMPKLDIDMITDYIKSASPPVKRLFRKIAIRDVYIDWVVGSDDAAKTALKYGGLCAAIYSAAELLRTYFSTSIKEINIEADFEAEKDDIFAYLTLKLRICTALGCAIWLGYRMLRTYLKYNGGKSSIKVKKRPVRAK